MFKLVLLSLLAFCCAVAVACGSRTDTSPAPLPTPTPLVFPPTWTPVVPTNIPTPITPTPNPAVQVLLAAMKKTSDAPNYRIMLDFTLQGALSSLMLADNPNQPVSVMNLTGEVSGKNDHYILKGFVVEALSADRNKGFEGLDVSGRSYVHGPVYLLGAMKNQWYILPADQNAMADVSLPADLLTTFSKADPAAWQVTRGNNEALDGKTCTVEVGDKNSIYYALQIVSGQTLVTHQQLAAIANAMIKFWICDGYLQQLQLNLAAPDRTHPGQTGAIQLMLHLYDFGTAFNIVAPPNPAPVDKAFYHPPATSAPTGGFGLIVAPTATPTFGLPNFKLTPVAFPTFSFTPFAFPTFQLP